MRPFETVPKKRKLELTVREDSGWKKNSIAKRRVVTINIAPKWP